MTPIETKVSAGVVLFVEVAMNRTLAMMLRLQELTASVNRAGRTPGLERRVVRLRGRIPELHLSRFDRLLRRRRVAVAAVSESGVCGACHLQLPVGDVWMVREASEMLASCPYCGCFLYDGHKRARQSKVAA
jgi:predicted  nucleic acid-binding Zn-ribbon protein